jgi:hypothetical protein
LFTHSVIRLNAVNIAVALGCLLMIASPVHAEVQTFNEMLEQRSKQWNDFIDGIYKLHDKRIDSVDYITEETVGGYGGVTNDLKFYREERFYEKNSGRLLSVIRWERQKPDNLHDIELYVYDEKGRVLREYSATFLPSRRAAPFHTQITLHYYNDDIHSFREFDASNDHLYEQCEKISDPKHVYFALHYEDIPYSYRDIEPSRQQQYRACFDNLAKTAEPYTNPLAELEEQVR